VRTLQILDEAWDSGLTAYGLALARGLADRGHESAVAARPDGHAFRAAAASGLPVLPLTTPWALRRAARSGRFDVVNAHTGRGHFWGLWAAEGAALVRTYGDARPIRRSAGRAFVYRRTHAVIAASAFIAAQFRARYPDLEERMETVYPGPRQGPGRLPGSRGAAGQIRNGRAVRHRRRRERHAPACAPSRRGPPRLVLPF
jgi:hypothetical protein